MIRLLVRQALAPHIPALTARQILHEKTAGAWTGDCSRSRSAMSGHISRAASAEMDKTQAARGTRKIRPKIKRSGMTPASAHASGTISRSRSAVSPSESECHLRISAQTSAVSAPISLGPEIPPEPVPAAGLGDEYGREGDKNGNGQEMQGRISHMPHIVKSQQKTLRASVRAFACEVSKDPSMHDTRVESAVSQVSAASVHHHEQHHPPKTSTQGYVVHHDVSALSIDGIDYEGNSENAYGAFIHVALTNGLIQVTTRVGIMPHLFSATSSNRESMDAGGHNLRTNGNSVAPDPGYFCF